MTSANTSEEQQLEEAGWAAMQRRDYSTAFANFDALLPTKDTGILDSIGWMLERGEGCDKDSRQAASLFRQSADGGSRYGLLALGDVLRDGGNEAEARAVYEEGTSQGITPSMCRLGQMLLRDARQPDEKERALSLLEEAAAEGNIFARRMLLGLEMKTANSIVRKAAISCQILWLTISGIPILIRNPTSEAVL